VCVTVRANNLTRNYPAVRSDPVKAVDSVTLCLAAGEMAVISGPSGSGKTTLLHLLGGLDRPDRGTVTLFGQALARLSDAAAARLRRVHVGLVFQDFKLLPDLSSWENAALPLVVTGMSRAARRRRVTHLLAQLGIPEVADRAVKQLSGGQQQRVALARALVNEPDLVLADEPTSQVDDTSAACVIGTLRDIVQNGKSVIVTTHDRSLPCGPATHYAMTSGRLERLS